MIKSIRLKNFFSFEDQTIRLNPGANLLVGINGSGKSNFIKAFELLRFGINEGNIKKLVEEKWKGVRVWNYGDVRRRHFVEIELITDKKNFLEEDKSVGDISYRVLFDFFSKTIDEIAIDGERIGGLGDLNKFKPGMIIGEPHELKLLDDSWVIQNRKISGYKHYLRQIEIYKHINVTRSGVQKSNKVEDRSGYDRLSPAFDNLGGLLNTMSISPETMGGFDRIYSAINDINKTLKGVEFGMKDDNTIQIQIKSLPHNIMLNTSNISDGTLKFLTLMSILYNPNRGNIICIEEPEEGLHPDMINMVAQGIKDAAKTSQMIVSTHSPFLLNAFELEDILVFENDEKGNTIVKELSQDDFDEWADDYMVGQLWLNGLLGGKRW